MEEKHKKKEKNEDLPDQLSSVAESSAEVAEDSEEKTRALDAARLNKFAAYGLDPLADPLQAADWLAYFRSLSSFGSSCS